MNLHLHFRHLCAALLLTMAASAMAAADPAKVLRLAFEAPDDGFDMVKTNNSLYSTWVGEAIFDTMLTYDYLARPAKLAPNSLDGMPEVSDGGKTYLFHLKKGIRFTPDLAFKGVPRELVAADYAYSIKRILDPKNRSPQASSYEGKIIGLDALVAAAKKTGKFDYDAPIAGFETPDRYTLRVRLNAPDQTFLYLMAHPTAGAVAREVIEMYAANTNTHPVGTGPYQLIQYVPRSKIVLQANPDYRGFVWNFKSSGEPGDAELIRQMQGKTMPQVGRVEISIIEEEQSRWLAFAGKQTDFDLLTENVVPLVLDIDKLKPEYASQGIRLYRYIAPEITETLFSFKSPVVGGMSKDKIALRRAIAMSYSYDEEIVKARFGQAVKAQAPVPPGVAGFDPSYRSSLSYDPALANKLLDHFGYRRGPDGFRTFPDGKPLVLQVNSSPSSRDKLLMELWKRALDGIGLRAEFPVSSFADNLKAASNCELMMFGLGGAAGIPDGSDFLESYYGPNGGQGNRSCYASKAFDTAFEQARLMPDGPQRQQLYTAMFRQLEADSATVLGLWRVRNWLIRPWVQGFKKHPIMRENWQYLDIEKH
jgi:ABC-type transport system substrate-binding protein